jgi:hypothetical protein
MFGQNYRDAHVRGPGHGSIFQVFHVRDVREALIYRNVRDQQRQTVFKGGEQKTEESHEADESDNNCYCSLDVWVCGAALLQLV